MALFGREKECEAIMLALAARSHAIMLGPPGCAKTAATAAVAKRAGVGFAVISCHRHMVADEVLGQPDLRAFAAGEWRRLPSPLDTDMVLLDEINRAPGGVTAALLAALQERTINADGQCTPIRLATAVAAVNDWPTDPALVDRFLVRIVVKPITRVDGLVSAAAQDDAGVDKELARRIKTAWKTDLARAPQREDGWTDAIQAVIDAVMAAGKPAPSDRRIVLMERLAAAHAVLNGCKRVGHASLVEAATRTLWQTPDDEAAITRIVMATLAPDVAKAEELAHEAISVVADAQGDMNTGRTLAACAKLREIQSRLSALSNDDAGRVAEAKATVAAAYREIAAAALGMDDSKQVDLNAVLGIVE